MPPTRETAGPRLTRLVHLTVHGIGTAPRPLDPGEEHTWVSVEQFETVLDAAVGRPHVRITFDDGNTSDLEIALPRLRERGLTATFFVLAGLLGEPGRLSAADVLELSRTGMSVGSHGWVHRDWRRLGHSPALNSALREELVTAPRTLGGLLGRDVTEVAIPFGSYDRHVLAHLQHSGATRVYTSDGGWARPTAWLQPRNSIRSDSGPAWAERVVSTPPSIRRRGRALAVRAAKAGRGRPAGSAG